MEQVLLEVLVELAQLVVALVGIKEILKVMVQMETQLEVVELVLFYLIIPTIAEVMEQEEK